MVNSNKFDIPPQFTMDGITWVILGQAFGWYDGWYWSNIGVILMDGVMA